MIKKKSSFIFIPEGRYGALGDVFNDYDILFLIFFSSRVLFV
ncbi:MAG: hypothetical protein AMXMBFR12_10400 [Candidatus Babeliales bacterium]